MKIAIKFGLLVILYTFLKVFVSLTNMGKCLFYIDVNHILGLVCTMYECSILFAQCVKHCMCACIKFCMLDICVKSFIKPACALIQGCENSKCDTCTGTSKWTQFTCPCPK